MDLWTVVSYAWAVFNSACAFVTAFCALWLVRHVRVRGVESESKPIDGERDSHESTGA